MMDRHTSVSSYPRISTVRRSARCPRLQATAATTDSSERPTCGGYAPYEACDRWHPWSPEHLWWFRDVGRLPRRIPRQRFRDHGLLFVEGHDDPRKRVQGRAAQVHPDHIARGAGHCLRQPRAGAGRRDERQDSVLGFRRGIRHAAAQAVSKEDGTEHRRPGLETRQMVAEGAQGHQDGRATAREEQSADHLRQRRHSGVSEERVRPRQHVDRLRWRSGHEAADHRRGAAAVSVLEWRVCVYRHADPERQQHRHAVRGFRRRSRRCRW